MTKTITKKPIIATIAAIILLGTVLIAGSIAQSPIADAVDFSRDFEAHLSGAQELPTPVAGLTTGGFVSAKFDEAFTKVDVELIVDGGANVMAAHFHCARAGVIGPVTFGLFSPGPLGFDGKTAKGTLTNADWTGVDCVPTVGTPVNNIAALAFAMDDGLIYANVHTTENPPGEIRGQLLS